jgi:hypothetical protein
MPVLSPCLGSSVTSAGPAGGLAWSLWAKKGIVDPYGIEQGGVVLNGRWYGLCGLPGWLVSTNQGNGSWGPGAGN